MKALKISQLVVVFFYITPVFAQQSPEDICKAFFTKYKLQNSDSALSYLFKTNRFANSYLEQTDNLKLQLSHVASECGMYFSNELVTTKTAGKSVVMLTFVVIHEVQPLIFRFSFYKPQDIWQILDFKFTTKVEDELEEASRLYHLKENIEF